MAENCLPSPPPTKPETPNSPPPVSLSAASTDIEASQDAQIEGEPAVRKPVLQVALDHDQYQDQDRAHSNQLNHLHLMVIAFCFQSASEIALQSLQTRLPIAFHFMRLAMVLSVATLCVAKYIPRPKFSIGARMLEHVGVLFGIAAFSIAVTISFPLCLKLTTWIIFALSLLAILVCNAPQIKTSTSWKDFTLWKLGGTEERKEF